MLTDSERTWLKGNAQVFTKILEKDLEKLKNALLEAEGDDATRIRNNALYVKNWIRALAPDAEAKAQQPLI